MTLAAPPRPLRILLSPQARAELAAPIARVLGARHCELLCVDDGAPADLAGADLAFLSRDVTGLSSKYHYTDATQAFYNALRDASGLQWLHIHSAGADRPIYQALRQRGVRVSTSSGANAEVVAQTALAGLLALARRFPQLLAAQHEQRWAPLVAQPPPDLAGQTAVIVGWGPIAQRLAGFLQMLGLQCVAVRHSPTPWLQTGVEMVNYAALPGVLSRADWLILACPLSPQTRGLVDARLLEALPTGAQLINVARGEVVVEPDLIAALHRGQLGGAFLDVFAQEPLAADSPLWRIPNVMLTPHSAGQSAGHSGRVAAMFLANLARWQAGQALLHCLD